ncbi:hypothetical protein SI65_06027 [Aspergillus cristatus]|uniref:Uncharacterized protein n=1 Tax=Aspergillus cristatus TaxID=573508 RepID=A0A1E3BCP2_ASPCR|nr:hypothetical protein SI65_06027 [Aspergillus cristatus]
MRTTNVITSDSEDVLSRHLEKTRISNPNPPENEDKTLSVNPFLHLSDKATIDLSVEWRTKPTELENLVNNLNTTPNRRTWNYLSPENDCLKDAKAFCERFNWSENIFMNFRRLLCGYQGLPLILLKNPKNDDLTFEEMVNRTPTLLWIKQVLEEFNLTLDNVMVLDMFPFLTNDFLDSLDREERKARVKEAFSMAIELIQKIRPSIVLSCQCSARYTYLHGRWGGFTNPLIDVLSSSMSEAEQQRVSKESIGDHTFHVIKAFHPAKIYYEDGQEKQDIDNLLRDIFSKVFSAYGESKALYKKSLRDKLVATAAKLHKTGSKCLDLISHYERIEPLVPANWAHEAKGDSFSELKRSVSEILISVKKLQKEQL